ncbi:MAG: hypothetical protein PHF09_02335 [Candidatus Nanoarchaeia archaeon]|jgi:hypothetical protein|nr:hypothetical protein [Candidatus Nanoarchaeia archaeon]MDD4563689.1 hypothetical protein [Candidatus Nanoarchaeia archaeon]
MLNKGLYSINGLNLLKITNIDLSLFSSIEELRLNKPIKLIDLIRDKSYKIPKGVKTLKNHLPFSTGDIWLSTNLHESSELSFPYLYFGKIYNHYDLWINLYTENSFGLTYKSYIDYFFPEFKIYPT